MVRIRRRIWFNQVLYEPGALTRAGFKLETAEARVWQFLIQDYARNRQVIPWKESELIRSLLKVENWPHGEKETRQAISNLTYGYTTVPCTNVLRLTKVHLLVPTEAFGLLLIRSVPLNYESLN